MTSVPVCTRGFYTVHFVFLAFRLEISHPLLNSQNLLRRMSEFGLQPGSDSFKMQVLGFKEVLLEKVQKLACCSRRTAEKAVEMFADDPGYEDLDDKIHVMLDWVTAYSLSATNFSKPMLTDLLQQLARCAPETARRAVEIFGDDPMYTTLDDKIEVMVDWVSAFHSSTAVRFSPQLLPCAEYPLEPVISNVKSFLDDF